MIFIALFHITLLKGILYCMMGLPPNNLESMVRKLENKRGLVMVRFLQR